MASKFSREVNKSAEGKNTNDIMIASGGRKLTVNKINSNVVSELEAMGFKYDENSRNFEHKTSGLVIAVYKDRDENIYVSFIGYGNKTKGETRRKNYLNGWWTNIGNAFGNEEIQYTLAIKVGETFFKAYGKDSLIFTGQSLGGGLASAAGLQTGVKTITFNAPGPNYKNAGFKKKADFDNAVKKADNITAYNVRGEFVWASTLKGGVFEFAPDPIGRYIYLDPPKQNLNCFDLHEPDYTTLALIKYINDSGRIK